MTDKSITIHARSTGLTVPQITEAGDAAPGIVLYQGQTITLTPAQVDATRDRLGRTWLDLTADEQVQRWGMQKFAGGPAPEGMGIGEDDDAVWFKRAITALDAAKKITNPAERKAALQAVNVECGKYLLDLHQESR
ncbi:hypothetical protein KZC51_06010 [Microbacterium sp. SSW1-49]|uniref:Uncharacterized protein n=1 Tax=Microbacterium croceum TaxID=2851645 RepID=A0ABT0FD62_9MICO|nr:hypothetical protein [Microbacterium croceum]MCK2035686.1 hypothetical protein [Microbacterium croceum]